LEVLTVLSIIALLSAILQPAVASARREALKSVCLSNLRQIGNGFQLYAVDWDDRYPSAISSFERYSGEAESDYSYPLQQIPDLVQVLSVYVPARNSWRCPSDQEPFCLSRIAPASQTIYATTFDFARTSYAFMTQSFFGRSHSERDAKGNIPIAFDASVWHSEFAEPTPYTKTRNRLYPDGHAAFESMLGNSLQ
jgi:type II secretory pathway pseudopilin PulG